MFQHFGKVFHYSMKHHTITEEKKRGIVPAFLLCLFLLPVWFFTEKWLLNVFLLTFLLLSSLSLLLLKYHNCLTIRPRHYMGIIFSLSMLILSLFSSLLERSTLHLHYCFGNGLFLICSYLFSLFVSILLVTLCYLSQPPNTEVDCIIILGCALYGEELTPLLKARTDFALHWYHTQIHQKKRTPLLIPSGGQGMDEAISEALAIQRYLLKKGIPPHHIRMECHSHTTKENMEYSIRIAREYTPHPRCLFSTTSYHVFRSTFWSRKAGMNGLGIGAPTKWYYWPSAFTREFIGILSATWPIHLGIIVIGFLITNL